MSLGFRMSHSLRPQPKYCNPSIPPSSDIDSPPHGSHIVTSSLSPSDIGGSKDLDPLGSTIPECEFPSLQATRRLSVKAKSGVQASRVFDGMSIFPTTPVFQSDYCREVVGARQSVNNEVPCVKFSPTIGYPVSLAIPNLESNQNGVGFAEGGASSVKMCSEELNSEGSGCCLDVAGSTPVDRLPLQDSTVQMMSDGAELLSADGLSILPMDSEGMVEGLTPVSQGVHLDCHPVDSHSGQIQLPHQSRDFEVTRTKSESRLPSEHARGSTGITWSSVVTKNTHGGHDAMGVAHSSHWLMMLP